MNSRRDFLRHLGLGAAALPFVGNLPSLGFESTTGRKRRLVVVFSPNGVIPNRFWPKEGKLDELPDILQPLEPFKDRTLVLHGLGDHLKGDGDSHMRGIGCLLTGIELFPGNIQGGSHTPAGWSTGHSVDQEIKRHLQGDEATRTRFGSLEFGVNVPDRADTWTRMVYAGPNQPIAPIDDPYQMFDKLYGGLRDRDVVVSVIDDLRADLAKLRAKVSAEDRQLLEQQEGFVRDMEKSLAEERAAKPMHAVPKLEPGVRENDDNLPKTSRMQIELMVNSFQNDFARIASLQYTRSVGGARMRWLGIDDSHHGLSHEPDSNKEAVEKLVKINRWFCGEVAHLAKRLDETPEPGGDGTMLDNTTILWTNELGKGNSHTLQNIPFVLVGGGLGFDTGRALKFRNLPHNRLLLALAHGMGHDTLETFGNPKFCNDGPLTGLV